MGRKTDGKADLQRNKQGYIDPFRHLLSVSVSVLVSAVAQSCKQKHMGTR